MRAVVFVTVEFVKNNTGLVCNARFLNNSHAIAPTLEGYVFILDEHNRNVSIINVNGLLGHKGFNHPHDAIFLPNGDFVVATWSPGRTGYFRRLPVKAAAGGSMAVATVAVLLVASWLLVLVGWRRHARAAAPRPSTEDHLL